MYIEYRSYFLFNRFCKFLYFVRKRTFFSHFEELFWRVCVGSWFFVLVKAI